TELVIVLIECLCLGVGATVGLSSILFSSVVLVCGSCRPADVCAGINIVGDIDLGACTQSYIQLSCGGLTNHHKSASVREHQGWCEHPPGRSSVMSARASLCFLGIDSGAKTTKLNVSPPVLVPFEALSPTLSPPPTPGSPSMLP
uniref:Uncharacterized protein n=1 Tax=Takifugu rubripes TaxID=31033 RepID=A0A674NGX5_TAKRU